MRFSSLSLLFAVSLMGCSSVPHLKNGAETGSVFGDGRVGTYVSSWQGFRASSYWIEGPEGLVFIDTQFLPSETEQMIAFAENATGKKAVLAIVLHPNPEQFNGTSVFQKHGVRVVTSSQVLAQIPAVHQLRLGWFYDRFKPDYPEQTPTPESFGQKTTELRAGGITLKAHVMGAGCSQAHVVVEYEGHFFVGDLITREFHSWLELGLLKEWLKRLAEIRALSPKWIHTGRGGSGDESLIAGQEAYLKAMQKVVLEERRASNGVLNEETSQRILNQMIAQYPAHAYPKFIKNGIEATWKNLK